MIAQSASHIRSQIVLTVYKDTGNGETQVVQETFETAATFLQAPPFNTQIHSSAESFHCLFSQICVLFNHNFQLGTEYFTCFFVFFFLSICFLFF